MFIVGHALRNRDDKTPFFPYTIKAWRNLNEEVKSSPSVQSFRKHLNKSIYSRAKRMSSS